MIIKTNIITPWCDMLINQNIYIEEDPGGNIPIGHRCLNKAEYQDATHFFCEECKESLTVLSKSSRRITFGPGKVQTWEKEVKEFIKDLGNSINEKNISKMIIKAKVIKDEK